MHVRKKLMFALVPIACAYLFNGSMNASLRVAEAETVKNFANYWMHIGLLTVDGEKMSKSLGNIVNVKDLIKKCPQLLLNMGFK